MNEPTKEQWIRKALRRAYLLGDGSLGYEQISPRADEDYPEEIELMVQQLLELV